jgi:hypothetical protein
MGKKDEAGLGLTIHWIHQALISAFEDNCPLRPIRKCRKSLGWALELDLLGREVRRLFNGCRANMIRIAGNSIERPKENTGKRYEKLPKRLGRLFVALSRTYQGQLGYIGLYLGALKSSWDSWWLVPDGVRSPKGRPWIFACHSLPLLSLC